MRDSWETREFEKSLEFSLVKEMLMKIIGGKISLEVDRALLELNVGAISDTKRLGKMLRVHLCQLYQIILECPNTD